MDRGCTAARRASPRGRPNQRLPDMPWRPPDDASPSGVVMRTARLRSGSWRKTPGCPRPACPGCPPRLLRRGRPGRARRCRRPSLSVAETRRFISRLTDRRPTPVDYIPHRPRGRRRRRYQARISHCERRGHSPQNCPVLRSSAVAVSAGVDEFLLSIGPKPGHVPRGRSPIPRIRQWRPRRPLPW
jgi:hypothetical protein